MAERLGTGLQNLLQRFDSARPLRNPLSAMLRGVCYKKRCYNGATKYRSFSAFQKLIRKNPDTSYGIREIWYSKRSWVQRPEDDTPSPSGCNKVSCLKIRHPGPHLQESPHLYARSVVLLLGLLPSCELRSTLRRRQSRLPFRS